MAGISSKAAGSLENKRRYNGIEQTTDLDLNQYDAFYRTLDPQIGRFWQIDPQSDNLESYSPYESMGNNPINNDDPLGDFRTRFGAWLHKVFHGGGTVGKNEFGEWYVLKTSAKIGEDGNPIITGSINYGKGRHKYMAAGEEIADEQEYQNNIDQLVRIGVLERVSTQEEANRKNLQAFAGVLMPNILRAGTITINSISAATKVDDLLKAGNVMDRGGLTVVGRALQKHGGRTGSSFPLATGNPASINAQGEAVLKGIITNPNVTSVTRLHARFGKILEYKIPGGQGARFSSDGKTFIGFIEHE